MNRRLLFVKILLLISFTTLKSQLSLNDVAGSNASSMMALQQISVTIGGEFIVNGSFPASATERVDQFITRTYNTYYAAILTAIKDENSAVVFRKKYEKFALRNIELIHKDGRKEVVDLANFRLTGDFSQNPYIKEGDLIIFPTLDLETNFISVTGAVNKELEFQFVEGDDLQTALFFARGINTAYKNVNKAIISRLEDNGQKEVEIEVNLNSDTKLKSGDRIRVIFDERNNFNYRVLVIGEVNRPGYIPISRNSTTLKEVITKAGGFTENASLKFSELIREYDSYSALRKKSIEESYNNSNSIIELNSRIMRIKMIDELNMLRNANLELRDTIYFNIDNSLRLLNKNYQLNFAELNQDTSFTSNFELNDGDIIVIPKKTNEVFVWGGVKANGFYNFNEKSSVFDYINMAGGYTDIAYGDNEVYLIKGKSYNWILIDDDEKLNIEPGDYIYAKKQRPQEEFAFYLYRLGAIAGILGGLATIYLAFKL